MNIFFTIATKSYLPLANTLAKSIYERGEISDFKFYIILVDGENNLSDEQTVKNVEHISALDIYKNKIDLFYSMAFRYDVTELSTAIKPDTFLYLYKKYNQSKIIFFDPDILIINPITSILTELDNKNILLTPHFLNITEDIITPNRYLGSGAYNLGFLGVNINDKVISFLTWWSNRCKDMCYREREEHLFTDQKWFDLITSFFSLEDLGVSRNIGHNVAPWNLHERRIIAKNNNFYVSDVQNNGIEYPIIFFHFSGFNYKNLNSQDNEKFDIIENGNLKELKDYYKLKLEEQNIYKFINNKYRFDYFDTGEFVSKIHRRIYRKFINNNLIEINTNPFSLGIIKKINLTKNHALSLSNKVSSIELKNYKIPIFFICITFRILRSIIGWNNYIKLLKFLRTFVIFENQYFQILRYNFKNYNV